MYERYNNYFVNFFLAQQTNENRIFSVSNISKKVFCFRICFTSLQNLVLILHQFAKSSWYINLMFVFKIHLSDRKKNLKDKVARDYKGYFG